LTFKPYSYFSGSIADVQGTVFDKEGNPHYHLLGKWTEGMTLRKEGEEEQKVSILLF